MLLSLNWISDFIKINKTPREIADKITLSLSEVEKIHKVGSDTVLEIENKALTHRPDCFSQIGLTREIAAYFNLSLTDPLEKLNKENLKRETKKIPLKVESKDTDLCPRYSATVLTNIKVGEAPEFIKNRLSSVNVRPINNVVDITNYVMLELGQPLHAFNYDKIKKNTILIRRAKKNETIITLDNLKRVLNPEILVIADFEKPIALAGIMGGKISEIDANTTTIVIESANFNAQITRKNAKFLNLRTEAVTRFEKNLDPNLTLASLMRTVELLQKYASAKVASETVDIYPKKTLAKTISTTVLYINSLLGLNLSELEIISLLKRLHLRISSKNNKLQVTAPSYRRDLSIEADIAEEVARMYGYDNIPTTLPKGVIKPPKSNDSLLWEKKTKLLLKGLGFSEIHSPSFISKDIIQLTQQNPNSFLKLVNPISPEKTYLRKSLLPGLLITSKNNLRFFNKFSLFEIGRVFHKGEKGVLPKEVKKIAGVLVGKTFYELKGTLDCLFDLYNITFPQVYKIDNNKIFSLGASALIKNSGIFGELVSNIKTYLGSNTVISAFELDFDLLVKNANTHVYYNPIPLYPPVIEDFSFIFSKNTSVGLVLAEIKKVSSLIANIDIIDRYADTTTFRISFQNPKKSLSKEEIAPLRKNIVKVLKKKFNTKIKGSI